MNIRSAVARIDKTKAAKKVTHLCIGYAVGKTVHNILRENTPDSDNPVVNFAINASCVVTGTFAAGFVVKTISDYADKEIDDIVRELRPLFVKEEEPDTESVIIESDQ